MKIRAAVLSLLPVALLCVNFAASALAQEMTLEKEAEKLKENVLSSLRVITATADDELAANRLDKHAAHVVVQHIDFILRLERDGDISAIIFHGKNFAPTTNQNLKKAGAGFDAAVHEWMNFTETKVPPAIELRLAEAAKIWRKAKSPAEISAAILGLKTLKKLSEEADRPGMSDIASRVSSAVSYLTTFRDFLSAEDAGNISLLMRASSSLQSSKTFCDELSQKEMDERHAAPLRKLREQANAWGKEAVGALAQTKSPDETLPQIEKLNRAAAIEVEEASNSVYGNRDESLRGQLAIAKDWRRMLELESTGALKEAKELALSLVSRATQSAPGLVATLNQRLEFFDRAEMAAAEKRKAAIESDLAAQLVALKDAEGAVALSAKVRASAGERYFQSPSGQMLSEALNELDQIGRVWRALESPSQGAIASLNFRETPIHQWRTQLAALQDRIRRHYFAAWLKRPEMLTPPLDSMKLVEVLEKFTQDAVARADWHAVHELLEAQAGSGHGEAIRHDLAGVRAFIAAQNFEKAQLLGDAVASYKEVIRSLGRRAPVEAAADRLKALKAENPELFTKPAR